MAFSLGSVGGATECNDHHTSFDYIIAGGAALATKFVLVIDIPNGTSLVGPPVSSLGDLWVQTAVAGTTSVWVMNGFRGGSGTFTWTWTTSSTYAAAIINIASGMLDANIDVSSIQANGSSASITAPSVTPTSNAPLLVNVYFVRSTNTITLPTGQTSPFAASSVPAGSSPATTAVGVAVGTELLVAGQKVTAVSAANPAVFSVASTTGLAVGDVVAWSGFTGADAAFLNTTNPGGVVTALSANVSFTIGALSTVGKTITVNGPNTKARWNGSPAANAATGTRIATVTAGTNIGVSLAFTPTWTNGGNLLPDGWNSYPTIPHNTDANLQTANPVCVGLGGAGAPARIPPIVATGSWVGISTSVGGPSRSVNTDTGGWAGFYKVVGHAYLGVGTDHPTQKRIFITPRNAQSMVLQERYSDPVTGYFEFLNLAPGVYDVWGVDHTGAENDSFKAVIVAIPM